MNHKTNLLRRIGICGIVGLAIAVGSIVLAERAYAIEEIWQLPLQKDLQGRIYETSIVLVDEKRPVVLATTRSAL